MRDEILKLPIYIKANEILELCIKFTDIIFDEYRNSKNIEFEMLIETSKHIRENAMIIAGAEGADIYDIRMENAAIIRKCAREIATNTYELELFNYTEKDYLILIREEIDEFRILFAEWVKTFDPWNYHIDRWGLFNPPDVEYDDPDDDLPFNTDDYFDDI